MLDSVASKMHQFSKVVAMLAGFLILTAVIIVFVDVILRSTVGTTLGGADELSGYALAIGTTWAMPYCLLGRHNIRVDTLYRLFPFRIRAFLDCLSLLAIGGFVMLLNYRAGLVILETIERSSRSVGVLNLPQIYPQSLWFAGLLFFTFAFVLNTFLTLNAVFRGDLQKLSDIAGPRSSSANRQAEQ